MQLKITRFLTLRAQSRTTYITLKAEANENGGNMARRQTDKEKVPVALYGNRSVFKALLLLLFVKIPYFNMDGKIKTKKKLVLLVDYIFYLCIFGVSLLLF